MSEARNIAPTVKNTLLFLNQQGLLATPKNYSVAYEFVSGGCEELREALDKAIENKHKTITDHFLDELYDRFLTPKHNNDLETIRKSLDTLMRSSSGHLLEGKQYTEAYQSALTDGAEKLHAEMANSEAHSLLLELAGLTNAMVEHTQRLQDMLESTSGEVEKLREELAAMSTAAKLDPLTGLYNRRAFSAALEQECDSPEAPYSIIMSDVDFFKRFNDKFGHRTGDNVLCYVANKLNKCKKGKDIVARYGGEEFILLLPETELSGAMALAESIRKSIGLSRIMQAGTNNVVGRITISCGVAQFKKGDQPEDVISRADAALYAAKEGGRDCVKSEQDLPQQVKTATESVRISK